MTDSPNKEFFYAVIWSARGKRLYAGKSYASEQYVTAFAEELANGFMPGATHVSVQNNNGAAVWSQNLKKAEEWLEDTQQ